MSSTSGWTTSGSTSSPSSSMPSSRATSSIQSERVLTSEEGADVLQERPHPVQERDHDPEPHHDGEHGASGGHRDTSWLRSGPEVTPASSTPPRSDSET